MKLIDNLINDLENYNRLSLEISIQIDQLKNIYKELIEKITNTPSFEDTNLLFDQLELLQNDTCPIIYKYNFSSDNELYQLVQDLDRLDDLNERKYWFQKFKEKY